MNIGSITVTCWVVFENFVVNVYFVIDDYMMHVCFG